MTEDPQRNFRSAYYEKVGFRGVEEKKSLEILLKDNPLGMLVLLLSAKIKVCALIVSKGSSLVSVILHLTPKTTSQSPPLTF